MTELGRSVDPFELDLLGGTAAGLRVKGLAEGHDTLLDTGDGALEDQEVVLDLTVADEATKTRKKESVKECLKKKIYRIVRTE